MKEAPPIVEMRRGNAHGEGTGIEGKSGNKTFSTPKKGRRRRQWQPSRQDVLLPGDTDNR